MNILFMCVANSARSQIAEGLARHHLKSDVIAESAGSKPSGKINPVAIKVMQHSGIDISKHRSKSWTELPKDFLEKLDYLITLCAEEECPNIPTPAKKVSWALPDPADPTLNQEEQNLAFVEAKEIIRQRVFAFARENRLEVS